MSLLGAFRPGVASLTNAELAAACRLPRSTVSRLTQTLLACGYLWQDHAAGAYRLAAPVLSLAHAMRMELDIYKAALPRMRDIARHHRLNVGLAVPDGTDMVYIDSVRCVESGLSRQVVSGSRSPIAVTALGRAYLASLSEDARDVLLPELRHRHANDWESVKDGIGDAVAHVREHGHCVASWQSGLISIAAPLAMSGHQPYVFNLSFADGEVPVGPKRDALGRVLMELVGAVRADLSTQENSMVRNSRVAPAG